MKQEVFVHHMLKALTMRKLGDRPDYWMGYQRGLRRRFHGETFGTEEEHELWMSSINAEDKQRQERGQGYRDGYNI